MRLQCLPYEQDRYNKRYNGFLRWLVSLAVILGLAGLALGVGLYFYPPNASDSTPRLAGSGGPVCTAVIVAPTLALCDAKLDKRSVYQLARQPEIPVTVIRSERVTDQTDMTLVRLQSAVRAADVHSLGAPMAGQRYVANGPQGTWDGTLTESLDKRLLVPQPAFQLGSGVSVHAPSDDTVVGLSAQSSSGAVIVSMRDLLTKFPEISAEK
jgi:hypothetical protein